MNHFGPQAGMNGGMGGLTDALASIENRISTLSGTPVHGQIQQPLMSGGMAAGGAQMGQAGMAAGAPAEISQLRTTISRLTDQINAQVASQVAAGGGTMPRSAAAAAMPHVTAHGDLNPHGPLSSLAAQVAERKRQLAEEAARRAAQPAPVAPQPVHQPARQPVQPPVTQQIAEPVARPAPRPAPKPAAQVQATPKAASGQTHDVTARGTAAVRELSAKLDTIKTDLVGMKRAIQRQSEKQAEAQSAANEVPQAEIERIASGIAALQQAPTFDPAGFDKLGDEISRLRQGMRGEMRDTVRNEVGSAMREASGESAQKVEAAVAKLSHDIESISASGSASADASKVEELSAQFAALRETVSDLPNTLAINRLEARLNEIAAQAPAPSHFEVEGFAQLESRLDEITRALVAVGMGGEAARAEAPDMSGIERLETRMSDLMNQVETLAASQDEQARQHEASQAEAMRELREASEMEAVTNHLVQLSERLTQIEHHAETSSRAAARALSRTPDLTGIESQLASLAQRLEENAAGDATSHQLASLEAQVAGLAVSLGQLDGMPSMDLSPVEMRLAEIENRFDVQSDHLSQGFEAAQEKLAVAAAQNAAEQVAQALGQDTHDGRSMAALAAELGSVQTALERSENRSGEMLDAVRQTLDAVTHRLGSLEAGMQAQTQNVNGQMERLVAQLMAQANAAPATADMRAPHVAYEQPVPASTPAPTMPAAAQLATPRVAAVAPALDAADMFDEGTDADFTGADDFDTAFDAPIEPGAREAAPSGKPDIASIVRDAKARLKTGTAEPASLAPADMSGADAVAAFNAANQPAPTADFSGTPDVIAAAQRAVRATREGLKEEAASGSEGSSSIGETIRKPIVMMAAGAVILVAAAAYAGYSYLQGAAAPKAPRISAVTSEPAPKLAPTPVKTTTKIVPITRPAADTPATPVREIVIAAPKVDAPASDGPAAAPEPARATFPTPVVDGPAADQPPIIEASAPAADPVAQNAQNAVAGSVEVPADITEAPLRAAAGAGDRLALHEIGVRYSEGVGVERNMEAAADWFGKSAERGFAPSQYSLGSLYEKGLGVKRDIEKAKSLYREAAAKGNARAMHNLAVVHAMGAEGQPADLKEATRWFLEAASLGVKDSQFNLGILYGQGMGVPQNLAESYKWFAVAARTGDKDAIDKQNEVAAAMDSVELAKAKTTAEAWRAATPDRATNEVAVPAEWRTAAVTAPQGPVGIVDNTIVKRAQGLLNRIGFTVGKPDGAAGPRTKKALAAFQRTWSLPPSGVLDKRTMAALEDANT